MTTTVTRYVNTAAAGGGDGTTNGTGAGGTNAYASLSAAFTAEFTATPNLVTSDIVLKIICEGTTADTSVSLLTVPDFTCDSTRYLWLYGDPNASAGRHAGLYSTSKYRGSSSNAGGCFSHGGSHLEKMVVQGLQFTNNQANPKIFNLAGTTVDQVLIVDGCILRASTATTATDSGTGAIYFSGARKKAVQMVNCVVQGLFYWGIRDEFIAAASTLKTVAYNNTLYGLEAGFDFGSNSGVLRIKNNTVVRRSGSTAACYSLSGTKVTATNLSDDATSPDGASYQSKTPSFVSAGTDMHLAGSDTVAKDAGTDLSADADYAFSVDIDLGTRSGTWDIGADELVAAATGNYDTTRLQQVGDGVVMELAARLGGWLEH